MPETYQVRLKRHLTAYKTSILQVMAEGVWAKNGRPYSHILPAEQKYNNLLAPYREDLQRYLEAHREITLHRDFHHLNSSQAMCFNLFFPLLLEAEGRSVLAEVLGVGDINANDAGAFERVPDAIEGTNFDFLLHKADGGVAYFEVKLSEGGFGTALPDARHLEKLQTIYSPRLRGLVHAAMLEPAEFFPRYQLGRNLSYLTKSTSQLFIVYPRANAVLTREINSFLGLVDASTHARVTPVLLEELVEKILRRVPACDRLNTHYREFRDKYLLP